MNTTPKKVIFGSLLFLASLGVVFISREAKADYTEYPDYQDWDYNTASGSQNYIYLGGDINISGQIVPPQDMLVCRVKIPLSDSSMVNTVTLKIYNDGSGANRPANGSLKATSNAVNPPYHADYSFGGEVVGDWDNVWIPYFVFDPCVNLEEDIPYWFYLDAGSADTMVYWSSNTDDWQINADGFRPLTYQKRNGGIWMDMEDDDPYPKSLGFQLLLGSASYSEYARIDYPADEQTVGDFQNFKLSYSYNPGYEALIGSDKKVVLYYGTSSTSFEYEQIDYRNLGTTANFMIQNKYAHSFTDYWVYFEIFAGNRLANTWTEVLESDLHHFNINSIALGDYKNPYDVFHPTSASLELGILTGISASTSKEFCNDIYADSDTMIGGGIAYGLCVAGSFMFYPSGESVNSIKQELSRTANAFPFDWATAIFDVGTALLTDDFIASSSNSSISLGFSVDFRGLDTSVESSRSFGTGNFNLMSAGMFDNVGSSGSSLMPIITPIRRLVVAMMWITFVFAVGYTAKRHLTL